MKVEYCKKKRHRVTNFLLETEIIFFDFVSYIVTQLWMQGCVQCVIGALHARHSAAVDAQIRALCAGDGTVLAISALLCC